MAKQKRSDDWGFPRWRSYGDKGRSAAKIRLCDREGCSAPGDRPAPKAPNSPERWYFCEAHAAEYNRNWNYFAGLSPEEAARRAAEEELGNSGFRQSAQWKWAGPGDGSRTRDEMRALDALERLGVSALAQLWQHAPGGRGAPVRPRRLRPSRRLPRAEVAAYQRPLVFLRGPRRRV